MTYRVVDPGAVDPAAGRPCELRRLSDPAGLEAVAINLFRADPGEQLPLAYHAHERQEEAFFVHEGTLRVETPAGEYDVSEGSLFAVEPGAPHRAYNPAEATAPVEVLALGAPPVEGDAVPYDREGDDGGRSDDRAGDDSRGEGRTGDDGRSESQESGGGR